MPTGQVSDVLAGRNAGLRGRKHAPTRLLLTPRIIARFLAKVKQGSPTECWPWTASKFTRFGYGQFNAGRDASGKQDTRYAHRVAFQIATGVDPVGAVVMHLCDNPSCCNPAHLKLGTQAENIAYAAAQGHYNGSRPSTQKITDAQVREIRASSERSIRLAERYGVTLGCISNIRHGRARKVA